MAFTVVPAKNIETLTGLGSISTNVAAPTFSGAVKTGQVNQTAAYVTFTLGSLTSLNLIFQASYDNVSWFTRPLLDFSSGSITSGYFVTPTTPAAFQMIASQALVFDVPSCYQFVRFGAYCAGSTTGSSLAITLGGGAV